MIKLYDDQKQEILKELKELYNQSVKNVKELKQNDKYFNSTELDKYEKSNEDFAKIIEKADKDLNSIDDRKWIDLFLYVTITNLNEKDNKNTNQSIYNNKNWLGNSD